MKSHSYSYSSSSSMFYNGKKRIVSQKSIQQNKINDRPKKSKESFVKLVQKNKNIKLKMGTKHNNNQWKIININSSKRKTMRKSKKSKKKSNSLKKKSNSLKKKGKIQKP